MLAVQTRNAKQATTSVTTEHSQTKPAYRPDIDGLRAIAVLSVVGFHAFPDIFEGGFIGVDIFFVISGFLISTIIFTSLNQDNFSFIEFYSRRIKRIFPALLVLIAGSLLFGWFFLFPEEYAQLGKHIAGGTGFVSNFILLAESGYFDNAAESKPLLHLWSLGIEEQFYIIWPLVLWWAWKKKFNYLKIAIFFAFLSFALNIGFIHRDAVTTFYSPLTRFWELLAGSILAYIALYATSSNVGVKKKILFAFPGYLMPTQSAHEHKETQHNFRSLLGAALLMLGMAMMNKDRTFPGWWALLPVAGSVLIISAGANSWINRVILSWRPLVWFGLISFPLYLWHWPLLSFVRVVKGAWPTWEVRVAAVFLSVVLAWLTYKFIEKPLRFGRHRKRAVVILLLLMGVVGVLGYGVYQKEGMPRRNFAPQPGMYMKSIATPERRDECFEIPFAFEKKNNWFCNLGDPQASPRIFAYGDSHALSLVPALDKLGTEKNMQIQFAGSSGCPPLLGIQSMRGEKWIKEYNCKKLNERIFEHVKNNQIDTVLLIARWTYYTGGVTRPNELNPISMRESEPTTVELSRASFEFGLKQTIEKYASIGVKIFLVEDNPQQLHEPKDVLKKFRHPSDIQINKLAVPAQEHIKDQYAVSKLFRNFTGERVKTINFNDLLCNEEACPLVVDGKFLYSDDDHLSVTGAMHVYPRLYAELVKD